MNGYADNKDSHLKRMRRIEGQVRGITRRGQRRDRPAGPVLTG